MRKGNRQPREERVKPEFEQAVIEVARVTRVQAGGKRMRFRSCVVLGNRLGKVGMGVAKGADVQMSVSKAVAQAQKQMIEVPIVAGTIPHAVIAKFKASLIMLKPAALGTGVIAGGAMRKVLDLAGVENVVGKMLGSQNKINNICATLRALSQLKNEIPAHMKASIALHTKLTEQNKIKDDEAKATARQTEEKQSISKKPLKRETRKKQIISDTHQPTTDVPAKEAF